MFRQLFAAIVLASVLCGSVAAQVYTVGSYQLVGSSQVTRTISEYTYKASLTNPGSTGIVSATAVVSSKVTTTTIQKGNLNFGAVPAGGSVVSSDTFTIRQDRMVLFAWDNLVWNIQVKAAPIANAGANQWVNCASLVTVDGSGSTSNNGALTYAWTFVTRPPGSIAALSNPTAVKPTFTADKVGDYKLQLIVSDATPLSSTPAFVTVSTQAVAPTANAGSGRTVSGGALVQLDGSGSSDPAGLALTYAWTWIGKPAGSSTTLTGPTTVHPSFTVDRAGDYVLSLIVNNGYYNSAPAQVTITTTNTPPVANPGASRHVNVGVPVTLNGGGSTDVNGDPLSYTWSFNSRPTGSAATLSDIHALMPTFTPDVLGDFVVQLVVNDGAANSSPATVTITTDPVAPIANAGVNQTLKAGSVIHLDGGGSTSGNNLALTYSWSLTTKPTGSTATLNNAAAANPIFTADKVGTYIAQLIVSDVLTSAPSTVTITSNDVAPVANAGSNQVLPVGAIVTLDATGSTDVDGDALTYSWSLNAVPTGSTASLSSTTSPKPTFTIDLSGAFVAQLIVSDGFLSSAPVTVTINTQNLPPTANAGAAQQVNVGATVTLDGSGSKDFNGLPLGYSWTLISKPPQSAAVLQNAGGLHPTFTVDKAGDYVAQLTVSDSLNPGGSTPVSVTISTNNIAPVARPGLNQNVQVGTTVHLDGSASTSTSGYGLTYSWSFNSVPGGSTASLANASTATPSFIADLTGTYIVQLIVNDSIQNSAPATVSIAAAQSQIITVNLNSAIALTFTTVSGSVHLSVPAGPAGVAVTLASDNPSAADVPASVTVTNGTQDAAFTVTTGSGAGLANISGSSSGFAAGSSSITVSARTGIIALFQPMIGAGRTFAGTVTLTDPAPTAGATLAVTSDNTAAATAAGPAIIAGGQTTGTFTVTGGATNGTANIGVSQPGYSITPAALTKTPGVITLGTGVSVAPGNNATLSVTLSQPAPAGATVTLTASPGGIVTVPATVAIAPNASVPVPQPQVAGIALGTAQVTATAAGYAPDTQSVLVQAALTLDTVNLQVKTDNTGDITVTSTSAAGATGLMVTLQIDDVNIATAPPAVQIQPGQTSAKFTVTGVAVGSTVLHVSATGATGASSTITVSLAPALTMPGGNPIVGKDLQVQAYVTLGAVAPPGNIPVTVTSGDSSMVLLSTSVTGDGSAAGGSASIAMPLAQGVWQSPAFYVQGLVSAGSTNLTITMPGYGKLVVPVTLTPSAVLLYAPGGWGAAFSVQSFASQNLTVATVRLNPNLSPASQQNPRPGVAPLSITVTSSDPSIGTVTSPATIAADVYSATVVFHGVSGGTATVAVTNPANFSTPPSGASSVATVTAATMQVPASLPVAKDLQVDVGGSGYVYLNTAAPADVTMTVTSDTPNLVFSTNPAVLGNALPLDIAIAKGQTGNGLHWYAQALADTGSANVTIHVPGYTDASFSVPLRSSGIALIYQSLYNRSFTTNSLTSLGFGVSLGLLAADGSLQAWQLLGPRLAPLTVNFTTTDSVVGPAPASIQIAAGVGTGPVNFIPGGTSGTFTLGVSQPAGWVIPTSGGASPTNYSILAGTVNAPVISVGNPDLVVGLNFETSGYFSLPVNVPAGSPITVTIASNDPNVLLSGSPTVLGTQTMQPITVNPGGSNIGTIYIQAVGQPTGPVTVTATASKYFAPGTVTVSVTPSGFSISTAYCSGGGGPINTTTFSPDTALAVCAVGLSAGHVYTSDQALRPGISQTVYLQSSDTNIGTVPASVTFNGGDGVLHPKFHPVGNGSAVVSLAQPTGFVTPTWNGLPIDQLAATVSAPAISAYPYSVGFNLQQVVGVSLYAGIPAGGSIATITSDNPSLLIANSTATPLIGTAIQIPLAASSTYFTLSYQATAASGTAKIAIAIPGFQTNNIVITLVPSGFYFAGGAGTYTLNPGGSTPITVVAAALDPTTGAVAAQQPLRDGIASLDVGVVSSTGAATVSPLSLTFAAGDGSKSFTITAVSLGSSVITLNQPAGCSTPANYNALTITVN